MEFDKDIFLKHAISGYKFASSQISGQVVHALTLDSIFEKLRAGTCKIF